MLNQLLSSPALEVLENIIAALDKTVTPPTWFGAYHILCMCIIFGLCGVVIWKGRNVSDTQFNLIIGLTSGVLLLFEIYKQLVLSYDASTDTWVYLWNEFPFQFCSTPMYVMLIISLLENGKVKDSLCAFMATYNLFAGLAVTIYPGGVFIENAGINVQTMVHHGTMLIMGVFMYASGRVKPDHSTVFKGFPIFLLLVAMAVAMNTLYAEYGPKEYYFSMFFIAPGLGCPFPVFDLILLYAPYPIFLLSYVGLFTVAGYLISMFTYIIIRRKNTSTKFHYGEYKHE